MTVSSDRGGLYPAGAVDRSRRGDRCSGVPCESMSERRRSASARMTLRALPIRHAYAESSRPPQCRPPSDTSTESECRWVRRFSSPFWPVKKGTLLGRVGETVIRNESPGCSGPTPTARMRTIVIQERYLFRPTYMGFGSGGIYQAESIFIVESAGGSASTFIDSITRSSGTRRGVSDRLG